MGEVPFSDLSVILNTFDIGIIPFTITKLTLSTNPIKLYEYFGYGIPVVSSNLPEVAVFSDLVYIAESQDEFSMQLKAALAERDPDRQARRRAVALDQTWDRRAQTVIGLLYGR
jgi:hypothetical protein